jgi:hypothetical protein
VRADKFRSSLEAKVSELLPSIVYETDKIRYTIPASNHSYCPDFKLGENDYIEVKGRLMPQERKKHLLIQEQHPEIRIRFFFDKSTNLIYKGSKTTYADWCDQHDFEYTDIKKGLPKSWLI